MKTFVLLLTTLAPLFLHAAPAAAHQSVCECRVADGRYRLFVAGKEVMEFGQSFLDRSAIDCAKYMATQAYCGSSCYEPACRCAYDGSRTKFIVAGREMQDFGSSSSGAVDCARHLARQDYCR